MIKKTILFTALILLTPASSKAAFNAFTANGDFTLLNINGENVVTDVTVKNGSTASSWTVNNGELRINLEQGSSFKLNSSNKDINSFKYNNGVKCISIQSSVGYAEINSPGSHIILPSKSICGGGMPIHMIQQISNQTQAKPTNAIQTAYQSNDGTKINSTLLTSSDAAGKVTKTKFQSKINLVNNPTDSQSIKLSNIKNSNIKNISVNINKNTLKNIADTHGTSEELVININSEPTTQAYTKNTPSGATFADNSIININVNSGETTISNFTNPLDITLDISNIENKENLKLYYFNESTNTWIQAGDGGQITGNNLTVNIDHLTLFAIFNITSSTPITPHTTKIKPISVPSTTTPEAPLSQTTQISQVTKTKSVPNPLVTGIESNQKPFFKKILEEAAEVIIRSGHELDVIIKHNNTTKDVEAQTRNINKYALPLTRDEKNLTIHNIYSINNFIVYGTRSTNFLGDRERASLVHTYKSNYKKVPVTQREWEDVLRIANGIWPSKRLLTLEAKAKNDFKKIYLRNPDLKIPKDNAAVTMIAYGLRPPKRNLEAESSALNAFRNIYNHNPANSRDWDIVKAIAYSGATREAQKAVSNTIKTSTVAAMNKSCNAKTKFTKRLKSGAIGHEVRRLQKLLKCLGYFPQTQKSTAVYGPITVKAVKNFQTNNNLSPIGSIGPKTRKALNSYLSK